MESMEQLVQLSQSMLEAAALLADDEIDDYSFRRTSTFLNVVALGNISAGKSAVLNSLIGHPVLPTGENGATRSPISIDLLRDESMNSKALALQIDKKVQQISASALRHSLQERLSKGSMKISRKDEISMKLRTSTAPPLKLIDLPGLDQRGVDESMVSDYAAHNDAILLVVVPASQAPEISSSRVLRLAKEYDADGTRTVGIISKIDKAAGEQKLLAAVHAVLLNQGPRIAADIPWVAMIGQSVTIASAQAGSNGESSLEAAWRTEVESLQSILTGTPRSKLGRVALIDNLARQIRKRMKIRIPNLLFGLQGKSQIVSDELVRLGEQMVQSVEGTRAIALELCREFEDQFLEHIATGKDGGWKVVATFEGKFPNRFKQLPLDRHFDINNVKRIVLEADGYQPHLISPEKGLRSLIRSVLEMAKEPSCLCVDEVHSVLLDIVSAAANATPGLARYPPFKREVINIASSAMENFRNEAKKMVVALVDMERAFVPPQHFIRLVQRRMERQRREDELNSKSSKKAIEAEKAMLNRATSPQTGSQQTDGTLKSSENSSLKVAGSSGEITAGYMLKKSAKSNGWKKRWFLLNEKVGKLAYTKKEEEKQFCGGVIVLEDCNVEEVEEEEPPESLKVSKRSSGPDSRNDSNLVFRITSKSAYKTVLKGHSAVLLRAENMADKVEWVNKISKFTHGSVISSRGPESSMRLSHSDGSLESISRRHVDPEEDLRWMAQEVRGYVEAVLNSLAANVPKAVVLCQVEKAKEDMLNQLYGAISSLGNSRIEELLEENKNVKRRREKFQRQSSILAKLTRQLSVHDSEEAASDDAESGDDWRSAFSATANGTNGRSSSASRYSGANGDGSPRNGDAYGPNSSGRRTPNRLPPVPPQGNGGSSSMYRY